MLKASPSLQTASQALINFQSCVGGDRSVTLQEAALAPCSSGWEGGADGLDGPNPTPTTSPHQTWPQHHEGLQHEIPVN